MALDVPSPDHHRLSLQVDNPASSSPFPSPGSPFFPPPNIGPHEFALKPPPASSISQIMRSLAASTREETQADSSLLPTSPLPTDGDITPTITASSSAPFSSISSPITPTPSATFQQVQLPSQPPQINTQDLPQLSIDRNSLTSSRPAPPSPALSRRTSAALSRHSSTTKSRRASRISLLSQSVEAQNSPPSPSPTRSSWLYKIRDFAYPLRDDRHVGRGPDVPRQNRPRHRTSILSISSTSSSTHEKVDEDAEDDQREHSWSSFKWNTLSSHFSWGGGGGPSQEENAPSKVDFERNFDQSSPTDEEPNAYLSDSDPEVLYEDVDGGDPNEDEPLIPGIYRALYAFEPEGTAEMALEEEQIVKVVGRGGGVGWAIVEKEEGGHALVPESYLELVRAEQV
ncbi:hypothetical protein C8Q75DRAFT_279841 [Abortiporus biennis]|nr:hypothetical protein C8Q75DRAFT_279841 [Abortiporus biennis]